MGKSKKGFNWKARQVVQTDIDNSSTTKIKLDSSVISVKNDDECNTLVIPSQKRKTRKKNDSVVVKKILSKSQRKRLEKIVEKKKKKENINLIYKREQFIEQKSCEYRT
ncbi:hypothetical protein ANN_07249 [Periplaneta americana]|uniref:Uncharacterized protein n=1 Tax=Periplaneta americana TaxID=6978 RepID=A0ABQ8THS7_PERAM|nr:hypothetical protein ANN_07249 [Periplaneta americana]